jgi:hypothetical protein
MINYAANCKTLGYPNDANSYFNQTLDLFQKYE